MTAYEQKQYIIKIINSAAKLFMTKGYKQTQMVDVAKDVSVSVGSIYNYFNGKKALFDITLKYIFNDNKLDDNQILPIEDINHDILLNEYIATVYISYTSKYEKILKNEEKTNDFTEVINTIYTMLSKYWKGILILERNELSFPKLSGYYFNTRSNFFMLLTQYLINKIKQGIVRPLNNVEIYARLIIENIAWFAMHRHHDSHLKNLDDSIAKSSVIDALNHAFLKKEYLNEN